MSSENALTTPVFVRANVRVPVRAADPTARTLHLMHEFAQCLHEYHLTDAPDSLLDCWREDAEEILWWLTDVHGHHADGSLRELVGDEDPALALVLADCRALVAAQGWLARRPNAVPLGGPRV